MGVFTVHLCHCVLCVYGYACVISTVYQILSPSIIQIIADRNTEEIIDYEHQDCKTA